MANEELPPESDNPEIADAEGNIIPVRPEDVEGYKQLGYSNLTPEQAQQRALEKQYSTPGQELLTAGEGLGDVATFGGFTAAETKLGLTTPEASLHRRQINPGYRTAGQIGGLTALNLIPGVGEAADAAEIGEGAAAANEAAQAAKVAKNAWNPLNAASTMQHAGDTASEILGLGGPEAGALSKIGSSAVKLGVDNMLFQSGDEISRMMVDPDQHVGTAMADIGMAGLLGGALGAGIGSVSPLWKAAGGSEKLGTLLNGIQDKLGGTETQAIDEAAGKAGVYVPPELRASLSGDPYAQSLHTALAQSDTGGGFLKGGQELQEASQKMRADAGHAILNAIGKTPEEIDNLENLSSHEVGTNLGKTLKEEIKTTLDPITQEFDKIQEKFKGVEVPSESKATMAESIAKMAQDEGYNLDPGTPQAALVNRVLKTLPNLKTLENVRKYQSVIGDLINGDPALYQVGGRLRNILRTGESDLVESQISQEAPALLADHRVARSGYAKAMNTIDSLNDALHVGNYSGPGSFLKALDEMDAEKIAQRLGAKGNVGLSENLASNFPQTAEAVRQYQISQLLKGATKTVSPGETINVKAFGKAIDALSPEMRKSLFPGEMLDKVQGARKLVSALDAIPRNTSNTAPVLASMTKYIPGSALGLASMLMGHNPAAAFLIGGLTKTLGRDVPDAARLAMLKFLGSSSAVDAEGFSAMTQFIQHSIKGEDLINKATKAVFKSGADVLPAKLWPSEKERKDLNSKLEALQADPSPLFDLGGKTGHYMPQHGAALANIACTGVNYLNSLRPNTAKANPLDADIVPPASQTQSYNDALNIAQQPLIVVDKVKTGEINPQDIVHLKTLYPPLYDKLSTKLFAEMNNTLSEGGNVPYKTRLGLSMFMAQPLDSTMTPNAIVAAQGANQVAQAEQDTKEAVQAHKARGGSMKNINKLASSDQTPQQAREANKLKA